MENVSLHERSRDDLSNMKDGCSELADLVLARQFYTLHFCYFDIRKYSIFLFHLIEHCFLKRMMLIKDH